MRLRSVVTIATAAGGGSGAQERRRREVHDPRTERGTLYYLHGNTVNAATALSRRPSSTWTGTAARHSKAQPLAA